MSGGKKSDSPSYSESPDSLRSIEIARVTDLISEGEIVGLANKAKPLTCVFFNETPLANADDTLNFKNVHVESRVGTQDQDPYADALGVESEVPINVELRDDAAWVRSLTNPSLTSVRLRLSVPSIQKTDSENNKTTGYSIAFRIELAVGAGAFYTVVDSAITGKKTSAYSRSYMIDLPESPTGWQLRVTRLTPNANSATIQDTMYIASTTEIIAGKYRMPMSATVRTRFDAESVGSMPSRAFYMMGRIIKVPTNYDPVTLQYTGIWDGTFKLAFTRNPAWMFYDLATNDRYGLGHIADANAFDKWALYNIARYCDQLVPDGRGGMEPRFQASVFLQTAEDATRVMQNMASMFRGICYVAGNVIVPMADMPRDIDYIYTPANVIDGKFNYSGSSGKVRHTVALVSWNDLSDFSRAKIEYVSDDAGIQRYGYQETSVIAMGCTSQGQARRMGNHILLTERLETDLVGFDVGLDGTLVAPGHLCAIADPLRANKRMGGRIRSASVSSMIVDAVPEGLLAGHTVMTVTPSGTVQKNIIQSIVGTVINVTVPFAITPVPQSMWLAEMPSLNAAVFRVLSVTEREAGGGYTITALQHVEGKFDAVEQGIKIAEPPIAQLPAKFLAAPAEVHVSDRDVPEQNTTVKIVTIEADSVPEATSYHFMWRIDNNSWVDAGQIPETTMDITGLTAGVFVARVTASNSFAKSAPTFSDPYNIAENAEPPLVIGEIITDVAAATLAIAQETADRGAAIAAEAAARAAGFAAVGQDLADEEQARLDGDVANANATAQALLDANAHADAVTLNERNERITAVSAESNDRLLLATQVRGAYTGSSLSGVVTGLLAQEKTARSNQYDSLVQQISLMSAGVSEQFDAAKMWYFTTTAESWTSSGTMLWTASWIVPPHNGNAYAASPRGLAINAAEFNELRVRVRKIGSPTWDGALEVYAAAGNTVAYSAALGEPIWDADGIGIIALGMAYTGNIDGFKMTLDATTDASNHYAFDWIAVGRPAPGASTTALSEEATIRANAVSAEATARQTLSTKIAGAPDPTGLTLATLSSGLLYDERTARSTADASEVTARQTLAVTMVGTSNMAGLTLGTIASGLLYDERVARATADSSEVTARQSLSTRITGFTDPAGKVLADLTTGLLFEEKSARSTADASEVTARQTLAVTMVGTSNMAGLSLATLASGLLYDEKTARTTADATEVTARQSLSAKITGASDPSGLTLNTLSSGLLFDERSARVTADSAEVTARQALSAKLTGSNDPSGLTLNTLSSGLIYDERVARATAISAEATQRQALASTVADKADASVVNTLTTRVTAVEGVYNVNLLLNPSLAFNDRNWQPPNANHIWNSASRPEWQWGRNLLGAGYQVAGTNNWTIWFNGTTPNSGEYISVLGDFLPLQGAGTFIFSAWVACAQIEAFDVTLQQHDADGVYISDLAVLYSEDMSWSGGTDIGNWRRMATPQFNLHANTRFVAMRSRIRTKANGAGARMHVMMPMLERVPVGQTTPSAYNTGATTAWAEWDLTFNVNGYISGIQMANDGSTSAFRVAADQFEVRSPVGTDALTWEGGVLTARKLTSSLKLGAGFGSHATDKMLFWYGDSSVTSANASLANAVVGITSTGKNKLGGAQANLASGWTSGATVSYSAGSTSATIAVAAGTFNFGGFSANYSAASVGVSGAASTTTTFYLYYYDPGRIGGAQTLMASTDYRVTFNNPDNVYVNSIAVTFTAVGAPPYEPPPKEPRCVSVNAYVIAARGMILAGDVIVGDSLLLDDGSWGDVSYSEPTLQFGVRVVTNGLNELSCSVTAPIRTSAGVYTPMDLLGRRPMLHTFGDKRSVACDEIVMDVVSLGEIPVQHITIGSNPNKHFLASNNQHTFFSHHNMKMDDPLEP